MMKLSLYLNYLVFQLFSHAVFILAVSKRDSVKTDKNVGFECGEFFFSDKYLQLEVQEAKNSPNPKAIPLQYQSPYKLYKHWPLKFENQRSSSFCSLVLDENYDIVDVIAATKQNNFTKCIRVDSSASNSPKSVDRSNGYECSEKFFSDQWLDEPVKQARTGLSSKSSIIEPYHGNLYPKELNYVLWPIFYKYDITKNGKSRHGETCLLLDSSGRLISLMVKGKKKNILRCKRTWKALPAPADDPKTKLFVPPPKPGFTCGRIFFPHDHLTEAARKAKQRIDNKFGAFSFPKEYRKKPCTGVCYEWPLRLSLDFFVSGKAGKFRLLMDKDFSVMTVIITENDNIHVCEREALAGNKKHSTKDFKCHMLTIKNSQAVKRVEIACANRNKRHQRYPQIFNPGGSSTGVTSLIYPFTSTGSPRGYFISMNEKCELVGMYKKHLDKLLPCLEINANESPRKYTSRDTLTRCKQWNHYITLWSCVVRSFLISFL